MFVNAYSSLVDFSKRCKYSPTSLQLNLQISFLSFLPFLPLFEGEKKKKSKNEQCYEEEDSRLKVCIGFTGMTIRKCSYKCVNVGFIGPPSLITQSSFSETDTLDISTQSDSHNPKH